MENGEESQTTLQTKGKKQSLKDGKKNEQKTDDVKNSDKILHAIKPLRIFLVLYGRMPFVFKRRDDGTPYLHFAPASFGSVYFFVSSAIVTIIFSLMTVGFITLFLRVGQSTMVNRCDSTWESWELGKYCVLVSLGFTWLCLTVIGSIFLIKYGHAYVHYLNYWFKAVDIIDMDVTEGARRGTITGHILMLSMVTVFIALYIAGIVPSLNEGSGALANAMVRLFIKDIFWTPIQQERQTRIRELRNASLVDDNEYCGLFANFDSYAAWKLFGFIVQLYAIIGSRIFITQFRFFARLLKNAVNIWNARLKHALAEGEEDPSDQTKRRLDFKLLLKDHLILAQLFRMTETCFALIVQSFYFIQVANVGFQLYFFSQLGTVDTCNQYFKSLENSPVPKCRNIYRALEDIAKNSADIDFDDAICGDIEDSILPNTLVALILFLQTLILFHSTTGAAADAYEQAIEGFAIVRRHGFMLTKTSRERNFIHCMIVSFARNNPMVLSAAGYFIVSRPLTLVVIATVVNYYVILLQFKPGNVPPCQ